MYTVYPCDSVDHDMPQGNLMFVRGFEHAIRRSVHVAANMDACKHKRTVVTSRLNKTNFIQRKSTNTPC